MQALYPELEEQENSPGHKRDDFVPEILFRQRG